MDRDSVISLIDERFHAVNGGMSFEIVKDGVRQEGDWWYVPVVASIRGKFVPREVTVNIFANIETEMEERHDLTILFVPAVA
jgi:hypothetical protein